MTTENYIAAAREQWERDGEIEFDQEPAVSVAEDASGEVGAYVQAWVWIGNPAA